MTSRCACGGGEGGGGSRRKRRLVEIRLWRAIARGVVARRVEPRRVRVILVEMEILETVLESGSRGAASRDGIQGREIFYRSGPAMSVERRVRTAIAQTAPSTWRHEPAKIDVVVQFIQLVETIRRWRMLADFVANRLLRECVRIDDNALVLAGR